MGRVNQPFLLATETRLHLIMKALCLTLACVFSFFPLMSYPVAAQQRGDERYEERKRFPLVRKVFRKIRGDVRYHVGALRETASGIGHDVKSTIRGEGPPRGASQNQVRLPECAPAPPTSLHASPGAGLL